MKKNHKREVFLARIMFAVFLVLIAAVIALVVMLISSHLREDNSGKVAQTSEKESDATESIIQREPVTPAPSEQETEQASEVETVKPSRWTTSKVNFRKEASTEGEIIQTLEKDTEVEWLSEAEGWANVQYNGQSGYVSAEYLTETNPNGTTGDDTQDGADAQGGTDAQGGDDDDPNGVDDQTKRHEEASSIIVVIDPGHQSRGDSSTEPNGPGSTTMKAKVTDGATGVATGVPEYQLNLDVSLLLKKELEERGYQVKLTRSTNDVNISNKERAEFANSSGADIAVRIHANSVDDSSVRGALTVSPSRDNPYVPNLYEASMELSEKILDAYCEATGIRKRSCTTDDGMTGINWSTVPVTILELGFMSNEQEDQSMQEESMQKKMAKGIANGLDDYFGFYTRST